MGCRLGDSFKIFWDDADNWLVPTFKDQTDLGDIDFDDSADMVEVPKRIGVKVYLAADTDWQLGFSLNVNTTSAFYLAVLTAIRDKTPMHIALADGPIATVGTRYDHAHVLVKGPRSYGKGTNATMDVEMVPWACTPDGEDPETVVVAA